MEAGYVKHSVDNSVGALSDVISTLGFCERQIFAASDDHSMRDETEAALVAIAHTLSTVTRLLEWEIGGLEKIAAAAGQALTKPERRASV